MAFPRQGGGDLAGEGADIAGLVLDPGTTTEMATDGGPSMKNPVAPFLGWGAL